ncbi:hypothetical protein BH10PSE10_BH10PSE10_19620 [soil metagenome]
MTRSNRSPSKLTVITLIALTCALAGCGRKAGLDAPPGAAADQANAPSADAQNSPNSAGNLQSEIYRAPGSGSVAVAPKGQKKRIPLDAILD